VALILNVDTLVASAVPRLVDRAGAGSGMNAQADLARSFAEAMPGISPGVYDERDFNAVAAIIHREAGIMLPPGKAMLVYSRLAPLVRASGRAPLRLYRDDRAMPRSAARRLRADHQPHVLLPRGASFRAFRPEGAPRISNDSSTASGAHVVGGLFERRGGLFADHDPAGPDKREAPHRPRDIRILASDIADHALKGSEAVTTRMQSCPDLRAWTSTGRRYW
jgi:chemotaxis protein methyltransferase CheR